jgi:AraC family transcriptional regulator
VKEQKRRREIFGRVIKHEDCGDFVLVESLYPPKTTMPRHTHETAHISVVLQGNFTELSGRRARSSEASTLIIHPPDEDHAVKFHDAGARVFSFKIKPRLHERIRDFTNVLDAPAVFQGGRPTWLAVELYRESKTLDAVAPLMMEALALEIIAAASRRADNLRERSIPRWLRQAREYLHAHFAGKLSFAVLAKIVGVHPVYLAREFRRAFGCTMGEYVRRLRIETACRKMTNSELPLDEIALVVGFYDQSHFSNVFKRLTGATPSQYRAAFRRR